MTSASPQPSPCISVCQIDPASGQCLGCYRTRDEVSRWRGMSEDEQRELLEALRERQEKATGQRRRPTRRRP